MDRVKKDIPAPEAVSCDIQTLTVLLMGYQRPKFLHSIERLQAEPAILQKLEELLPLRTTYFTDFF